MPPRSFGDAGRRRSKFEASAELGQAREFERWAEEMYEELTRAQQGQQDLEAQLAGAKEDQGALERELECQRRRCTEVERNMHVAHSHASSHERDATQVAEENAALRTQCSAYAVEVERLREEHKLKDETVRKIELELKELQARGPVTVTKPNHVTMMMTLRNISVERLHGREPLQRLVKEALRLGVIKGAEGCGERWIVRRNDFVEVERLLTDSDQVRVLVAITPPPEEDAHLVMSRLERRLPQVQAFLDRELSSMEGSSILPGAEAAQSGATPGVEQVVLATRCGTCHDQGLQHQLEAMGRKHEAEQVSHEGTKEQLRAKDDALKEEKNKKEDLHKEHRMTQDERARFSSLSQELLEMVNDLQDEFVQQTRAYMALVSKVREERERGKQAVDDSESLHEAHTHCMDSIRQCLRGARGAHRDQVAETQQLLGEAEKYESKLHHLYNENRSTAGHLREHKDERERREAEEAARAEREAEASKEKRRKWLAHHDKFLDPKIMGYLQVALQGVEVVKVQKLDDHKPGTLKPPKSQKKLLRVALDYPSAKDEAPTLRLKWRLATEKQEKSWVDIKDLVLMGFGWNSRAPRLLTGEAHAGIEADRCLSLFSLHRSFDFVFAKDEDCQAFAITLSRLCAYMHGWPLMGGLNTRAKFMSAKGWCKVQHMCMKRGKPLIKLLLEALQKTASRRAAEDYALY